MIAKIEIINDRDGTIYARDVEDNAWVYVADNPNNIEVDNGNIVEVNFTRKPGVVDIIRLLK